MTTAPLATPGTAENWVSDPVHRAYLAADASRQLAFFERSLRPDGAFDTLDRDGAPLPYAGQELHTTTRLVHSYALGHAAGHAGADRIVDAGMAFLLQRHRDRVHGGYAWTADTSGPHEGPKLAYGHVFVLLAAASAHQIGHPDADTLLADISEVLETRFWDESYGLLREEFAADWTPLSSYRGMNANMHGVEAMLAAHEATGEAIWLERAGRILDFFVDRIAPAHGWRLPEHFTEDWRIDPDYAGDPMFRPPGTTPGHSLEIGRLGVQHWDLAGRPGGNAPGHARSLIETALDDAWRDDGGLVYTLHPGGHPDVRARYWWPVTEGIGALSALIDVDARPDDERWYRRLWTFADSAFVDHARGGWHPEIDEAGQPAARQFRGKPDIYHALQAVLFPLAPGVSRPFDNMPRL